MELTELPEKWFIRTNQGYDSAINIWKQAINPNSEVAGINNNCVNWEGCNT